MLGVLAAWPEAWPLAVLYSGDPEQAGARSRWSVVGRPRSNLALYGPTEKETQRGEQPPLRQWDAAAGRFTGEYVSVGAWLAAARSGHDDAVKTDTGSAPASPFRGGWIGWIGYDAGVSFEPAARGDKHVKDDRGWPLAQLCRVDDALIYDHAERRWSGIGAWRELAEGLERGTARKADPSFSIGSPRSASGQAAYMRQVSRAIEYIRAGDVYQVNLAHRLEAPFAGSPRGLLLSLLRAARPWYGGYCELHAPDGPRAVASISPELFLEFDAASRRITTRPMKGTRRGDADPRELLASAKDHAELNMIVDLMRNDLGRICEFGSVRVEAAREVERHGGGRRGKGGEGTKGQVGVLQTTATVSGRVRTGVGPGEILAAAFPGGSVTGAPKIRAMQVIDELEPVKRGPYCGGFGWFGDDGSMALNIMIRTALVGDGRLDYSAGAGIVADSDPGSEWEETLDKARVILAMSDAPSGLRHD